MFELKVNLEPGADSTYRVPVRPVGATPSTGGTKIALSSLHCGTTRKHQHLGVGGPIDCCGNLSLLELLALMTPQPEPSGGRARRGRRGR